MGLGLGILALYFFVRFNETQVAGMLAGLAPKLELSVPAELQGLPWIDQMPRAPLSWWIPGVESHFERLLCRRFPMVGGIFWRNHFSSRLIRIELQAREPLVRWQGSGLDAGGVLFPLTAPLKEKGPVLECAPGDHPNPALMLWLNTLHQQTWLWPQIAAFHEDGRGHWYLELHSGILVAWGPPTVKAVAVKSAALSQLMESQRMSGPVTADLRFFEDGRIIWSKAMRTSPWRN